VATQVAYGYFLLASNKNYNPSALGLNPHSCKKWIQSTDWFSFKPVEVTPSLVGCFLSGEVASLKKVPLSAGRDRNHMDSCQGSRKGSPLSVTVSDRSF
jgi:hypothetical protein